MADDSAFTYTDPELLPLLEELKRREPIFHTPDFGTTAEDFEATTAPGYWEVGASGRRYSRDFILSHLRRHPPAKAEELGWKTFDHALRRLGPDTWLMTYVLLQGERVTRRATIWEKSAGTWRILYHQGTIVSAEQDDTVQSPSPGIACGSPLVAECR